MTRLIMVALLVAVGLAGCSGSANTTGTGGAVGTLVIGVDNGSPTLQDNFNPFSANKRIGTTYMYEPLEYVNAVNGHETPFLATGYVIALDVLPQQAYANIQTLRTRYPGVYTSDGGFYDAVNPTTGAVGHRRLVLDQSMIMAALDNTLNNGALQRHFAADHVSWAARAYLSAETMSIG